MPMTHPARQAFAQGMLFPGFAPPRFKARFLAAAVAATLLTSPLHAQAPYEVVEAERCRVPAGHAAPAGFIWASNNGQVHEFWGEKPGDTIEFDRQFPAGAARLP